MNYTEILNSYITGSGLSLGEIARRMTEKGVKIDRSYLSKLKNGDTKNPASDDINKKLAEVTGRDPEQLIRAAYIEKAREPLNELIEKTGAFDLNELLKPIDLQRDLEKIRNTRGKIKNSDSESESELDEHIALHLDNLRSRELFYKGYQLSESEAETFITMVESTLKMWAKKN